MHSTQPREELSAAKGARGVADVSVSSCCVDLERTNVPGEAERVTQLCHCSVPHKALRLKEGAHRNPGWKCTGFNTQKEENGNKKHRISKLTSNEPCRMSF